MRDSTSLRFDDLFERGSTRLDMVCTFLAVLELIRNGLVHTGQSEMHGETRVCWTRGDDAATE